MGSFGSNTPQPTQQPNFQMGNYSDPLGSINANGNNVSFRPNMSNAQSGALSGIDSGFGSLVGALSNPNYFQNSPLYTEALNAANSQLAYQKGMDETQLNNDLNAKNQIGSSYDAYAHNLLNNTYANQGIQAQNNAYQNAFGNTINAIPALGSAQNSLLSKIYQPQQAAYQMLGLPLQGQSALGGYNSNLYNINAQNNRAAAAGLEGTLTSLAGLAAAPFTGGLSIAASQAINGALPTLTNNAPIPGINFYGVPIG